MFETFKLFAQAPTNTKENSPSHLWYFLDVKWCFLCFLLSPFPLFRSQKERWVLSEPGKSWYLSLSYSVTVLTLISEIYKFYLICHACQQFPPQKMKNSILLHLNFQRNNTSVGWESQEELIMPIRACSSTISVVLDQLAKSPIKLSINNWIHSTDVIDLNWTRLWQGNICI